MRIFYAFLIVVVAAILFMLPMTEAAYDFRTDLREDTFSSDTGVGVTTANVTLHKPVYDDDTDTIDIASDLGTDTPVYSSYNSTTRQLGVSGLTTNTSRTLTVSYDIDALNGSSAINSLVDRIPWIWMIVTIAFAPAAKEPHLVVIAPGLKERDGFAQRDTGFEQWLIGLDDFPHPGFDLGQFFDGEWLATLYLAKVPAEG